MKKRHIIPKRAERTYCDWAFRRGGMKRKLALTAAVAAAAFIAVFVWCSAVCAGMSPQRQQAALAGSNSGSDGFNMLVIMRADDGSASTLALFRCGGKDGTAVMPLPARLSGAGGQTFAQAAEIGPRAACAQCEKTFRIDVPYYIELDRRSLNKALSLYGGGFTCEISKDVECTMPDGRAATIAAGINNIDADKALALMKAGTEEEQCAMQGKLMAAFVSQKLAGYYFEHSADIYPQLAAAARTNYSLSDFYRTLPLRRQAAKSAKTAVVFPRSCFAADGGVTGELDVSDVQAVRRAFG